MSLYLAFIPPSLLSITQLMVDGGDITKGGKLKQMNGFSPDSQVDEHFTFLDTRLKMFLSTAPIIRSFWKETTAPPQFGNLKTAAAYLVGATKGRSNCRQNDLSPGSD